MERTSNVGSGRIFVVFNPASGTSSDAVRAVIREHLGAPWENAEPAATGCKVHETRSGESLADVVREALGQEPDIVVAAGGDGTVSAVADGLVGSETPLGIIPLGTANVLARDLGIPVELEAACRLLAGPHGEATIDAMRVGKSAYVTQLGVGIDSMMIRDTARDAKRRFGRIAYLWTAFTRLIGFQPRQFLVTTDDAQVRVRASQIVVANSGVLGQPPFRWGPDIRPDDGRLDVCIVRARSLWDYARIAWHVLLSQHRRSPHVRYLSAERYVRIAIAGKHALPVQADGEIIGETPVSVQVEPGALRVVVPTDR